MADTIDYIRNLINSLFLPALSRDFDETPIEQNHFAEYSKLLETQLPALFDFLEQKKEWFFYEHAYGIRLQTKGDLLFLLCEFIGLSRHYQLFQCINFYDHAYELMDKNYKDSNGNFDEKALTYYSFLINRATWKRNLGAVHGLRIFVEFRFEGLEDNKKYTMSSDWTRFCLSAGLLLYDCHDAEIKLIGMELFRILLEQNEPMNIIYKNIGSVIWNEILPHCMHFENIAEFRYKCNLLLLCIDADMAMHSKVNLMVYTLITHIGMMNKIPDCVISLDYIILLGYKFSANAKDMQNALSDENFDLSILQTRQACLKNDSRIPYCYCTDVLEIFIVLAPKLLIHNNAHVLCLLDALHRCYLVYVYHIPMRIIESHLMSFFSKFMKLLMKAIAINKENRDLQISFKRLLETFDMQQKNSDTYSEYKGAFEKLLSTPHFKELP